MLSIVVVVLFFVIVSILTARGDVQPRYGGVATHRIPLVLTTAYTSDSNTTSEFAVLSQRSSVYTAIFTIGHSRNLSLIVSTTTADIILQPDVYIPSPYSLNLTSPLAANVSRDGNASVAATSYGIVSDHVGIDGLRVADQRFANLIAGDGSQGTEQDGDEDDDNNGDDGNSDGNSSETDVLFQGTDGLFGLLPGITALTHDTSWTSRIQDGGYVPDNRFGILLRAPNTTNPSTTASDSGDDGDGNDGSEIYLGGLDTTSIRGPLISISITNAQTWSVAGTITFGNVTTETRQSIVFASSTFAILGPLSAVRMLFEGAGMRSRVGEDGRLRGYYDCEVPMEVGIEFEGTDGGDGRDDFFVDAGSMGSDFGNGTCVSVVEGVAELDGGDGDGGEEEGWGRWVVGYAFMRGKYVDFNMKDQTIGIGILKS